MSGKSTQTHKAAVSKSYKMCQSCGMPLKHDPKGCGTNADGSPCKKYCSFCYLDGHFTDNCTTVSQYQTEVRAILRKNRRGRVMSWLMTRGLGRLERWSQK